VVHRVACAVIVVVAHPITASRRVAPDHCRVLLFLGLVAAEVWINEGRAMTGWEGGSNSLARAARQARQELHDFVHGCSEDVVLIVVR